MQTLKERLEIHIDTKNRKDKELDEKIQKTFDEIFEKFIFENADTYIKKDICGTMTFEFVLNSVNFIVERIKKQYGMRILLEQRIEIFCGNNNCTYYQPFPHDEFCNLRQIIFN